MSPLAISLVAFGCILGGMLIGMFLRVVLPKHHLSDESKDAVKLGIGMIATLAALVLGLLIASAKGTFDTINSELMQTSSKIILLDRVMAQSAAMGHGPMSGSNVGGTGTGGAAIGGASKAGRGPANIVTDKEISDAMDVLERAKKQRENMKHNSYLTAFRSAKF